MKRLILGAVLCLLSLATPTRAADVSMTSSTGMYVLEGEIVAGDTARFEALVRDHPKSVAVLYLRSPGGNFYEAMKLGNAVRELEFATIVPRQENGQAECSDYLVELKDSANCTCASACVFVHMGGVHKSGRWLVAHRPYFPKGAFGQLSEADAEHLFDKLQADARAYMKQMGIPDQVSEDILSTPSHQGFLIDSKTIDHYFWGYLPARQEWLRNRCSMMSASEEAEFMELAKRASARLGRPFEETLGAEGGARLHALLVPYQAYSECTLKATRELQMAARAKYFSNSKPRASVRSGA